MVNFFILYFRFTNSNLRKIELHFELLTQSQMILEIQFYFRPAPFESHHEKTFLFFGHPNKSNYLYIKIINCSQSLSSKVSILVNRKPGTQN